MLVYTLFTLLNLIHKGEYWVNYSSNLFIRVNYDCNLPLNMV
uniref:Uncharacterized protein n=1 Tax=Siphoviridae sp. ctqPo10 TaxID=2827948 RepID=A0A8S5SUN3_9CAUD|nr:MAG TPA: hypothetical protein [Siphoviridae sp. ctqPo10]DAS43531.1 MAG TPA: hypothetical protein [Caudoviricetes sp.]